MSDTTNGEKTVLGSSNSCGCGSSIRRRDSLKAMKLKAGQSMKIQFSFDVK